MKAIQGPTHRYPRAVAIGVTVLTLHAKAQDIDTSKLTPPADRAIAFGTDVLPILENHCYQCHGDERPKGGLNLKHRETALEGGDYGADILPGDSKNSPLIHYVSFLEEDMEMPPIGKADRLSNDQIAILRAWIDQGAIWEEVADGQSFQYTFSPTLGYVSVSGNERKFREHYWQDDGLTGGLAELTLSDRLKDGTQIHLNSRSIFETESHEVELSIRKPKLGYIELGYDQFRRYYGDNGGFYRGFGQPPISLNRDLYLDNGRAWIDVGLTLPDWPTIVLGYEHQYRDGEKSMIHWGPVFPADPAAPGRGISPSSKHIDEETHIIKLDIEHEWRGWDIEESFRGEFTDFRTSREMADFSTTGTSVADSATRVQEDYDHFSGANIIRAEKSIKPWWLISAGYLYADLSADAGFNLENFLPSNLAAAPFQGDRSRAIVLDRDSHVINFNTLLGPFNGLSFYAGVQNDWTSQSGEGDLFIFGAPAGLGSNLDQITTEENFGLRFTKLKNTVLYLDTKFQQRDIGQRENQFIDDGFADSTDFMRDTDAIMDHKEYRTGLTYSPWRWASLNTWYRRRFRQNEYNHLVDTDLSTFSPPGNGFPAFIRSRDTDTDDFNIKLTLKPWTRVRTSLSYRLTSTDFRTATDSVDDFGTVFPASTIYSGNYDAHIYTLSTTFQPKDRLYLSATASVSDLRTSSGITDGALLVPFEGQTYTLLGSANYILSKTLDWNTTYSFSRADFGQSDTGLNLPIGMDYDRHGIVTGFSKKLSDTSQVGFQYGFFTYDEPTVAGANDYTAHSVFLTYKRSFR
ncbi:hypothetical protein N8737_02430 [Verrucomicrobia bacterium]|jgi:hypothetical protein|nr:hypothetical protein [Verrucomicrobiota bacterium]MDA7657538.1 hypothetical protein [Verrucomicrobiota bacterium]